MKTIITLLLLSCMINAHMLGVHPPIAIFDLFKKDNKYTLIVLVNNAHTKQYLPTTKSIKQELTKTILISKNKKNIEWEITKTIQQGEHTKLFISLKTKISDLNKLKIKISFLHTKLKQVKNLTRIFMKGKTRQFVLNKKITTISL